MPDCYAGKMSADCVRTAVAGRAGLDRKAGGDYAEQMRCFVRISVLLLLGCARSAQEGALSDAQSLRALQAASKFAVAHFGAPSCRDRNANWVYVVRDGGGTYVANLGPKDAATPRIRILMAKRDFSVVEAAIQYVPGD